MSDIERRAWEICQSKFGYPPDGYDIASETIAFRFICLRMAFVDLADAIRNNPALIGGGKPR